MKLQNLAAGAAFIAFVLPAACKSGTQAGGPIGSSSGLASITVGEANVTHKVQELTVTIDGNKKTHRGKENFSNLSFKAGQKVTLGMTLYTDDNKVAAQTVEGADSKCKPVTLTLAAGNNPARIPLCIPSEPGRPVTNPATATTATTTGQNADLEVKPCIVGKDEGCGENGAVAGGATAVAAAIPEFNGQKVTFDYVLFAIDISGSMTGNKWNGAKAELKKVAEELAAKKGTETVINVIAFNGSVTKFLDGEINSVSAELDNLKKWLDDLKPSGQTAMKAGLTEAFSYYSSLFKAVYLITDGAPTDMGIKDADLEALKKENTAKIPVHVHAISPDADYKAFLEKLASQSGGSFKLYNPQ